MECQICGNIEGNTAYMAREMMFGFQDEFQYFQCAKCECLQILEIPENIAKYYPPNYYSFLLPSPETASPTLLHSLKKKIRTLRNQYAVLNYGFFGKLIYFFLPSQDLRLLSKIPLARTSRILDVGCGSGTLLYLLKEIDFENLLGIDPYNEKVIEYKNGLRVEKKSIRDIDGKWDVIMFHHSFEHLPDPLKTMQTAAALLDKEGVCLIRIPIISSYAWEQYKTDWVQLDAPRHFFLHSTESMKILAEKSGFSLEEIIYDSTEFQFWGSEQYLKNIPLMNENSYLLNPKNSIFSKNQIASFQKRAEELNEMRQGDSAAFILRKK